MSDVGIDPPDHVRYYIDPDTGMPAEERTYYHLGGAVSVSAPMPDGAKPLTHSEYGHMVVANRKAFADAKALVAGNANHLAGLRSAARDALVELGLSDEHARVITGGG